MQTSHPKPPKRRITPMDYYNYFKENYFMPKTNTKEEASMAELDEHFDLTIDAIARQRGIGRRRIAAYEKFIDEVLSRSGALGLTIANSSTLDILVRYSLAIIEKSEGILIYERERQSLIHYLQRRAYGDQGIEKLLNRQGISTHVLP